MSAPARVRLIGEHRGRCSMKSVYPKEAFARNAAGKIFESTDGECSLYPYKCPECRKWHLTSKIPERKRR